MSKNVIFPPRTLLRVQNIPVQRDRNRQLPDRVLWQQLNGPKKRCVVTGASLAGKSTWVAKALKNKRLGRDYQVILTEYDCIYMELKTILAVLNRARPEQIIVIDEAQDLFPAPEERSGRESKLRIAERIRELQTQGAKIVFITFQHPQQPFYERFLSENNAFGYLANLFLDSPVLEIENYKNILPAKEHIFAWRHIPAAYWQGCF